MIGFAIRQVPPLRAPLGATRQALLASPSRGEVNAVDLAACFHNLNATLSLVGRASKAWLAAPGGARKEVYFRILEVGTTP